MYKLVLKKNQYATILKDGKEIEPLSGLYVTWEVHEKAMSILKARKNQDREKDIPTWYPVIYAYSADACYCCRDGGCQSGCRCQEFVGDANANRWAEVLKERDVISYG